jgi:DNA-binding IclR family transcriptional regulator
MNTKKRGTRITSIQRALRILDFIGTSPNGFQVKEIAYALNINLSTCYHILNTLVDEGYVIKRENFNYVLDAKLPVKQYV